MAVSVAPRRAYEPADKADRNITDPRALAIVLEQAEDRLARRLHPDPVRRELNVPLETPD